jgi:hypothetical protein
MPQTVTDQNPVQFSAAYASSGAVYLLYSGNALPSSAPHVEVNLIDIYQTKLGISDFTSNSTTQEVYAHRVTSSGSLSAWTRVSGAVESPTYTFSVAPLDDEIDEFDVMVRAVASGSGAPTYTNPQDAEQAGASRVRVKIIKRGSRPDGFVQRR